MCQAIRCHANAVYVPTLEEDRCMDSIVRVSTYLLMKDMIVRPITRWSEVSTVTITPRQKSQARINRAANPESLFKTVNDFVERKCEADDPKTGKKIEVWKPEILVLCDVRRELGNDAHASSQSIRLIREAVELIRYRKKTIILMGPHFDLPPELQNVFMTYEFELPTTASIREYIDTYALPMIERAGAEKPSETVLHEFSTACTGLTRWQSINLTNLSFGSFGTLNEDAVRFAQQEKAKLLLREGSLEMRTPRGGLEMVGGLDGLKAWVGKVTPIVRHPEDAKSYGLRVPSGLLMVGTPGCGKSLLCEALGGHWGLPVLLFNVGAAYGSLVGESEANIRRMQSTAKAMAPCIVMVDEIEKGLGGDSLDGGTSNRVKQSLLTWLQEKPEDVFVVATANDLTRLSSMPELIRAGRFDKIFFVDLPDAGARREIFRIHFGRAKHEISDETLDKAVGATEQYSGAEIESVVQESLRDAFNRNPRPEHPDTDIILAAAQRTKPLGVTMRESIERLREWCRQGRAEPAGRMIEDDIKVRLAAKEQQAAEDATGIEDIFKDVGLDDIPI